jgi:hypothetical protein
MKVAIVVGIKTDAISEDRYPEWLTDIPQNLINKSKEKWGAGEYGLASDIAIAYYVQKYSKDEVDILTKKDISLQTFNKYDIIFGLYEPYYFTNETKDSTNYAKYNHIIQKTNATFCHPLCLQKFVLNKKLYMDTLRKHDIPVVDNLPFLITDKMNTKTMIQKIVKHCDKWGSPIFITKPQPGGFGIGFKKWNIDKVIKNQTQFNSYMKKIQAQVRIEKPLLLVQSFVPEFEKYYEIRTYWLNGTYSHSLGTIIDPESLGNGGFEQVKFAYPENEYDEDEFETYDTIPEVIDMKLINHLKKLGKKVIDIVPKDKTGVPFLLRVDFGCCLNNINICRDYFVNEIEYVPNLFPEYATHVDILKRVGKAIIKKTNDLKKKK